MQKYKILLNKEIEMEPDKQLIELATKLAESTVKNSASAISTKISGFKAKRDDKKTIQYLEDTVNALLADKTEVIRIAQAYEQELISQRISDSDIDYITKTVVPLVEKFLETIDDETERAKIQGYIDLIRSVLSKESITVMQLLGFNFKQALGEPLTTLVRSAILAQSAGDKDYKKLELENSNLSLRIAENQDATERFLKLVGRS